MFTAYHSDHTTYRMWKERQKDCISTNMMQTHCIPPLVLDMFQSSSSSSAVSAGLPFEPAAPSDCSVFNGMQTLNSTRTFAGLTKPFHIDLQIVWYDFGNLYVRSNRNPLLDVYVELWATCGPKIDTSATHLSCTVPQLVGVVQMNVTWVKQS